MGDKTVELLKPNEGWPERITRTLIGAALFVAGFFFKSWIAILLWVVGAVLLVTGLTGFCWLYAIFGFSTNKKNKI